MAGEVPPQESGLTCNTWYGKHHTEMIWWHAAHFALWGHDGLLARNLAWYQAQSAGGTRAGAEPRACAARAGPRWWGPRVRESPGGNPLIVWNQPHMVYLCELLYRSAAHAGDAGTLPRPGAGDRGLPGLDGALRPGGSAYVLGPPLWIAQEIYDQATSQNPSFELAYWQWALETAQQLAGAAGHGAGAATGTT